MDQSPERLPASIQLLKVLGPPSVDGRELTPGLESALFAYMVWHADHQVSADELEEVLWPSPDWEGDPRNRIPTLFSNLGNAFGPARQEHLPKARRGSRAYQLNRNGARTDIDLFTGHLRRARKLAEGGDDAGAADAYRAAETVWPNGEDDLVYLKPFPRVLGRFSGLLEDWRQAQIEFLTIEVERFGRYEDSLRRAREVFAARPADERAARLLAWTYAGLGKHADALEVLKDCAQSVVKRGGRLTGEFRRLQDRLLNGWSPQDPRPERGAWRPGPAVVDPWGIPDGTGEVIDPRLLCPGPSADQAERVRVVLERLARWALSPDVMDLFDSWPNRLNRPEGSTYREVFADMVDESEKWDFRQHRTERWAQLVVKEQEHLRDLVVGAAAALGMREQTLPTTREFNIGISLGGARLAPLCRTKWLGAIAREERAEIGTFAYATSFRPVDDPAELAHTGEYAPGAAWEFELMHAAAGKVPAYFGRGRPGDFDDLVDERPAGDPSQMQIWAAWSRVRRYRVRNRRDAFGVAGASDSPREHRPRTPDTLVYLFEQLSQRGVLKAGASALLVTSAIYIPYQHIEALRVFALPHNVYVETVGFPRFWNAPTDARPVDNLHDIGNYLQEIRSSLQACQRLADDFPEGALELPAELR